MAMLMAMLMVKMDLMSRLSSVDRARENRGDKQWLFSHNSLDPCLDPVRPSLTHLKLFFIFPALVHSFRLDSNSWPLSHCYEHITHRFSSFFSTPFIWPFNSLVSINATHCVHFNPTHSLPCSLIEMWPQLIGAIVLILTISLLRGSFRSSFIAHENIKGAWLSKR